MRSFLLLLCLFVAAQSRQTGGQTSTMKDKSKFSGARSKTSTMKGKTVSTFAGYTGAKPAAPVIAADSPTVGNGYGSGGSKGGSRDGSRDGSRSGSRDGSGSKKGSKSRSGSRDRSSSRNYNGNNGLPACNADSQCGDNQYCASDRICRSARGGAGSRDYNGGADAASPRVGALSCFSADDNRVSQAKCPIADAENKCVNMPNCVWGDAVTRQVVSESRMGSAVRAHDSPLHMYTGCVWDMDPDFYEGPVSNEDRQREICASYSESECIAAAAGLMNSLCRWTSTETATQGQTYNRMMADVHSFVVDAMNSEISALDLILGVAFLVTAAFGIQQFQQWRKERAHKGGMIAKEWPQERQRIHVPIF
jgi:hypothetical protein